MDAWDNSPSLPVPLDILLDILVHLPLQSVLALRRTCRSLYTVTHLRALWALLFRAHVLDQHVPCPHLGSTSLADLSARDLECLVHRALTLRRTWTTPEPVPRRHITFNTPTESSARIIFLQFLPGRSNRWLISIRMTARPRSYLLQCWDVGDERPRCVAVLKHADGPFGGVVLNSDPSSPAMLAMQSAQTETFSIRFDAQDPESAFETGTTIDGIRELHLLSGSTLVTRRIDEGGALCLWDLADLGQEKLQLLNPSLVQPDDRIQAIHVAHDYAIVVRIQTLEIYSITPRPGLLPFRGAPIAYPLAQFKFQWRIDTVVLCEQHLPLPLPSSSPSPSPRPIHLFIRFGSLYPWPVNILHHYVLLPNPTYHTGGRMHARTRRTPTPTSTRRPSPTTPSPLGSPSPMAPLPTSTTEYNLPYDPRPYLARTIGSPVRLFGQSAMALGPYGTALWLDHHTEAWSAPGERGQRLAGQVVRLDSGFRFDGDVVGHGGTSITGHCGGTEATMETAMVPVSATGAEQALSAHSNGASMMFGLRGDDAWSRIAMEEEAGRIALGHTDGAITLLEY